MQVRILSAHTQAGFTLIELSIVLVIIGLIIGGILTGQDLINAAATRAQLSQIEKYNTAVNTFRGKYGFLPGDIPNPYATQFGFQPRGACPGQGDGNGIIEGNYYWQQGMNGTCAATYTNEGVMEAGGETPVFWVDLSAAGLIDGTFNVATISAGMAANWNTPQWFPAAKIGQNNYVYVFSMNGSNYYSVSQVSQIDAGITCGGLTMAATAGMTVQQANNIDLKVDDGLPQSGNVIAFFVNGCGQWAAGGSNVGDSPGSATSYHTYNCYDNNGNNALPETYSLLKNQGAQNCALSFKFQ